MITPTHRTPTPGVDARVDRRAGVLLAADDERHGTVAGEIAERRLGQPVCAKCRAAKVRYEKRRVVLGGLKVPALGTRRRIQALRALGHSMPAIAAAAMVPVSSLRYPQLKTTLAVTPVTALGVRRAYRALSMVRPEGTWAETSRKHAAEQGWPPPLAWTHIDDESEIPTDWHYAPADRAELFDDMTNSGATLSDVLRHLQVTAETLEKWADRNERRADFNRLLARERGAA